MTREQEGGNLPLPTEIMPDSEVDDNAFRLIQGFKVVFQDHRIFQQKLSQVYFGQLDYGYEILPENARQVGVWLVPGQAFFDVDYSFTHSTHYLAFERQLSNYGKRISDETVFLKARRFEYLQPDPEPRLRYLSIPVKPEYETVVENNNQVALRKASELLADVSLRMRNAQNFEKFGGTSDPVDNFLGGLGLTRGELFTLNVEERNRVLGRLRRIAGQVFHPNGGISPNEQVLLLINNFLESAKN